MADLLSKESGKKEITLLTASGSLKSRILGSNLVETEIGIPKVNWEEIPLSKQLDTQDLKIEIVDKNNTKHIGGTAVNVGNPHIIFFVDDIEAFDLQSIGPKIENHQLFPEKCIFLEIVDDFQFLDQYFVGQMLQYRLQKKLCVDYQHLQLYHQYV